MSAQVESIDKDGIHEESFQFSDWRITSRKSHILQSKCTTSGICHPPADGPKDVQHEKCVFCRFEVELQLPTFPDMTFGSNLVKVEHKDGFGLVLKCLDALKKVQADQGPVKVGVAEDWQKSRIECKFSKNVIKPFDWTFTTDYQGTLLPEEEDSGEYRLIVSETDQRIDVQKLMLKEEILFYDDVHLFEDELADNGVAQCSAKIRVMKSGFFILLRYFLRIDSVMVRINDTRIYHEIGKDYLLREYSSKESSVTDLNLPIDILLDPVKLTNCLPTTVSSHQKLTFPVS